MDRMTDLMSNIGTVTIVESDNVTLCIIGFSWLRLYKFDNFYVNSLQLYNLVVPKSVL